MTKTEIRVLSAIRTLERYEFPATIFSFKLIFKQVHRDDVWAGRKKTPELRVVDALAKLVEAGTLVKHVTVGMGGGFTDYRRVA